MASTSSMDCAKNVLQIHSTIQFSASADKFVGLMKDTVFKASNACAEIATIPLQDHAGNVL